MQAQMAYIARMPQDFQDEVAKADSSRLKMKVLTGAAASVENIAKDEVKPNFYVCRQ